jgi:hypothetical protein
MKTYTYIVEERFEVVNTYRVEATSKKAAIDRVLDGMQIGLVDAVQIGVDLIDFARPHRYKAYRE